MCLHKLSIAWYGLKLEQIKLGSSLSPLNKTKIGKLAIKKGRHCLPFKGKLDFSLKQAMNSSYRLITINSKSIFLVTLVLGSNLLNTKRKRKLMHLAFFGRGECKLLGSIWPFSSSPLPFLLPLFLSTWPWSIVPEPLYLNRKVGQRYCLVISRYPFVSL